MYLDEVTQWVIREIYLHNKNPDTLPTSQSAETERIQQFLVLYKEIGLLIMGYLQCPNVLGKELHNWVEEALAVIKHPGKSVSRALS
jgi:hypothetical protein